MKQAALMQIVTVFKFILYLVQYNLIVKQTARMQNRPIEYLSSVGIGGHLVRYSWSVISDWAWYGNFRYRTERAESDIISDIGMKFYPVSDIRHSSYNRQSQ